MPVTRLVRQKRKKKPGGSGVKKPSKYGNQAAGSGPTGPQYGMAQPKKRKVGSKRGPSPYAKGPKAKPRPRRKKG